jgi:sulfur-carrier protein
MTGASVKVHIPTPLRSYTNASVVPAAGATLAEMFADLEARYPGLRFRVINEQDELREHIKVFVNQTLAADLSAPLNPGDDIRIITAISGG